MSNTIPVIVRSSDEGTVAKGILRSDPKLALMQVDLTELKENLTRLREDIAELLEADEEETGFHLQEIEVGVEVTASGGVNLIGSFTAAGKAAIKLKFIRG